MMFESVNWTFGRCTNRILKWLYIWKLHRPLNWFQVSFYEMVCMGNGNCSAYRFTPVREISQVVVKLVHKAWSGSLAIRLKWNRNQFHVTSDFRRSFFLIHWNLVCWKRSWLCSLVDPNSPFHEHTVYEWLFPCLLLKEMHEWMMEFGDCLRVVSYNKTLTL